MPAEAGFRESFLAARPVVALRVGDAGRAQRRSAISSHTLERGATNAVLLYSGSGSRVYAAALSRRGTRGGLLHVGEAKTDAGRRVCPIRGALRDD